MVQRLRWGVILEIIKRDSETQEVLVEVEGRREKALLYPQFTGEGEAGDRVLLNTTAVYLGLGTGGYHFGLLIEGKEERNNPDSGHIIKLRYTPYQFPVYSREEEKETIAEELPPVIALPLHSMLAPVAIVLAEAGFTDTTYIMTDGGALPISFSKLVRQLKAKGIIGETITVGHAFGGDQEMVNVYSALVATGEKDSRFVIAGIGPGHVGTGTVWGFSGLQQGEILNAASTLGTSGIGVPRISFTDRRRRHLGLSHHSQTSLGKVCQGNAYIFLPDIPGKNGELLKEQSLFLSGKKVFFRDPGPVKKVLKENSELLSCMGRSYEQDSIYFETGGLGAEGALHIREKGDVFDR